MGHTIVPSSIQDLDGIYTAGVIAAPCSSTRIGLPLCAAGAYLSGRKVSQITQGTCVTADTAATWRLKCLRRSGVNNLLVMIYTELTQEGELTVQAGTGTAQVLVAPAPGVYWLTVPWGGADSGACEVTFTADGNNAMRVNAYALMEVPREDLYDGDVVVHQYDTEDPLVGQLADQYITDYSDSDTIGYMYTHQNAIWTLFKRNQIVWGGIDAVTMTGESWDWIFPSDYKFRTRGRRENLAATTVTCTAHFYCKYTPGAASSYAVRIVTSQGTYTSGSLTNTSYAWTTIASVDISTSADESIYIQGITYEMNGGVGNGIVSVKGFSLLED